MTTVHSESWTQKLLIFPTSQWAKWLLEPKGDAKCGPLKSADHQISPLYLHHHKGTLLFKASFSQPHGLGWFQVGKLVSLTFSNWEFLSHQWIISSCQWVPETNPTRWAPRWLWPGSQGHLQDDKIGEESHLVEVGCRGTSVRSAIGMHKRFTHSWLTATSHNHF